MKLKLSVGVFFGAMSLSQLAFSALPAKSNISTQNSLKPNAYEQSLYEQLAGKPTANKTVNSKKIAASATKALTLARQSRSEKNYILAIKRYNFILKYYPRTSQAKVALMDKASMYKEMGLNDPYVYNQKKVSAMKLVPASVKVRPNKPTAAKASAKPALKR